MPSDNIAACVSDYIDDHIDDSGNNLYSGGLVVAANRDENHTRPTLVADFWQDDDNILGGRDLQAGGTWLGVTRSGRFAAVTNFAETIAEPMPPRSRGELTRNFLAAETSCRDYLQQVHLQRNEYRGFNLLISDGKAVYYYANREGNARKLDAGFYGLSNQLLDCNWPKVIEARQHLQKLATKGFEAQDLFELLAFRGDHRAHSARFIIGENYGTCAATVVSINSHQVQFEERLFDPAGNQTGQQQFNLKHQLT